MDERVFPEIAREHYDVFRDFISDLPPTHDAWIRQVKGWKADCHKRGIAVRDMAVTPGEVRWRMNGPTGAVADLERTACDKAFQVDESRKANMDLDRH